MLLLLPLLLLQVLLLHGTGDALVPIRNSRQLARMVSGSQLVEYAECGWVGEWVDGLCMRACVRVCVSAFVCVCVCAFAFVGAHVYAHVCACMYMYFFITLVTHYLRTLRCEL